MEKLNKKNGEKVSVQSKNQRGIFYRLKDRLKLNKKNGKKVIVQAEDQPSLAYELTNKYKLEKNKSDDMKALVALGKDLSKYAPATIEGILFYLPLTPEKKNLFQPRNRIVQPEDQQSHAYRLTNKYELKMERTNPEKFAKLGRELSRYDPATIEGILLHLPLIPEEKDLLQPRNRIVQPEDQLELADRLIDKYKLKNKHTNLKTMAALGKDLSRYDPDSTEGILLHLPLIPEEKKQLQPRNRIVQPEDQLELAYRITKKYKLKHQHTNLKTFVALGKDLSRYDPDSTAGILLHLPLIPEEKNLLQPRNRIVKPEDRLELADRLTDKYNLKMERTDPVTFAKLDRELSKYDSDSTAGILLHLPLIPEEKNLLQPRNRIVKPENQPNLAYRLTKKYKLKNQHTNVKTLVALGKELSKYDPNSTEGILLLLPLIPEEKKLLQPRNRIAQPKNQPALAYELTEEKKQSTNMETLVALDKDLSKDDPTSSEGNISNLPLNPEEKKLLQPSNRIAQPEDQPALAYELTEEKKQSTNMETLVTLDKDLSKDDPTSSGGNISNRPLNPEEKNLLQQRTIEMESIDRTFFIDYLNEQHNLNSNTPLSEKTKAALIEDLDKFYYLPLKPSTCYNFISDLHIINRDDVYELLNDQIPKVNELITQVINNATLAITNKYQLLENQSVPKEKLETITTEILDLNLGEEQEREVIAKLEISKEDRATLEEIYREKRDLLQTQESQKDAEIKAATIAITNTYELSVEKTTPQEKLKAIANELINRNLSTLQEHEIIYLLEIETKDRDTLRTIYKELKKIQENQKDANVKAVTIAFKNIYELSKDQSNSPEKLNKIAKTIVDLDLSEEQKREVILELKIPEKDKATLREMYSNELEKNLNGERVSIATAISSKYQLSVEKTTPQEKLNTIAKKITKLDLSDEQKREVIRILEIPEKDQDTLREMYLNKFEEKLNWKIFTAATAISSKYQLSVEKTTPQEKLKAIANELMDLNLSKAQEKEEEIIHLLAIETEDRDTLRTIYKELKKIQVIKKVATLAITTKYELSEDQSNSPEKLNKTAKKIANLDLTDEQKREVILELKIPEKDQDTLLSIYEEQKKAANIAIIKKYQPNAQYDLKEIAKHIANERRNNVKKKSTESEQLFQQNVNAVATTITNKHQLSEDRPATSNKLHRIANEVVNLNLNIDQKLELMRTLALTQADKDKLRNIFSNSVINDKIVSLLAEEIKVAYQLTENKTISPKDLHNIAITIENSSLDKKYMDAVPNALVMTREDKETLRDMIRERAKQQTEKKQENEADIKINGKTIAEVLDDNALLLSRAMDTALELKENEKVKPEILSMMAEFIGSRKLNEINRRNIPYMLTLTKEDKEELSEIINEKTTLLNKELGISQVPAKMNLSSTLSQGLNNLDSNPKDPLQTSPKPNLRTLLNQSENTPGLEPNTSPKPGTLPKAPARINLLNVVVQNKIVSLLAETIKVNYQLSENKTTSPKDLHEIAITIENSYLDEKYMDTLSDNLVMRIEEKEALRDIIRERAKQQTDKKQENEADIKINGKTIAEVLDDNALLLSRAMNTALALNENQKVEPKMLSTMAEFIGSRKLNEINRRNIPYMLTLTKEDKKELNEIINGKTTLLSKLPELDRTNPNPIDQVPLPLNQRLSNRGSEQNTLPKPNKNIKQMNSLSQGSAEVSR
ncbi:hypothetical protein [Enterococcus hirae]|uniref:hypothetical protein n=1 Tax=Enterococcus hirae TaxID=1354 RepID=UPI002003D644|nr:hypothetical protein [Enterococcus hirae]MCK6147522.1 hypothetical protein [Enterococcus hirae]MCK6174926.1 hypothetical protein [Enterococcus hirae]